MRARLAEGKGKADHAAAQAEDDVPAVQDRARRRRRRGRPGGDQGREEHQLEILGSGKNNKSPSFHLETMHLLHLFSVIIEFLFFGFSYLSNRVGKLQYKYCYCELQTKIYSWIEHCNLY